MPTTLSVTCPTCNANVNDDDRACSRCGADVAVWSDAGRTPLILPGNPAFGEDMFRGKRGSMFRIAVGSAVGCAAVMGAWLLLRDDEGPPPPAIALLPPQPRVLADSEIIKPLPPIFADEARAADTVKLLPPIPAVVPVPEPVVAAVVPPATVITPRAAPPVITPRAAPVVAAAPTITTPARTPATTPAAVSPPVVRSEPRTVAAATAPVSTARPTTAPPVTAPPLAATPVRAIPVLRVSPLVSDSMRTGELLQLRWTVQDKSTGRALAAPIEFTTTNSSIATVDRSRGIVTARAPGRVQIIADGGAAGWFSVNLTVRTTQRLVVSTVPAETLTIGTEAARSTSVAAPPARVTAPIVSAPTPAPAREAARVDQLDADDVRTAVNRFVTQIRNGDTSNPGLVEFLGDGAGHRVTLVSPPATISASASVIRVTFEMRLTKFDGGGRPMTRVAPVSMDIEKRQGDVSTSDIAISPLRRP
jgi:hypothetical protein